ncbi:MAG: peptidase domain-containing ABC transporter [Sphingobium sp.]
MLGLKMGRRRLPIILSGEAAECGLACIAMVANSLGHDIDLAALRRRHPVSLSGLTVRGMLDICSGLGLGARPVRAELHELADLRTPAILHWDLNHFVVLKQADARFVVIHDPSHGMRRMRLDQASSHFTGVAIELSRQADLEAISASQTARFSSLWSDSRGIVPAALQIFGLACVLQVLTFALPFQVQLAVDEAIGSGDVGFLAILGLAFGAIIIVRTGVDLLRAMLLQAFSASAGYQIVSNIVSHLMRLRADWFEKRHVGDILSRIRSAQVVQDVAVTTVVLSVLDAIMALFALVLIWLYSPLIAVISIGFTSVNLLISWWMARPLAARAREEIVERAREQSHLMESIRAAATLRMMARDAVRESEWRNIYLRAVNATLGVGRLRIFLTSAQGLMSGLQQVVVIGIAAAMVIRGEGMTVGMMFAVLSFRQTFSDRMAALVNQLVQIRMVGLHLDRVSDIVNEPRDEPLERTTASYSLGPDAAFAGAIEFDRVCFAYGTGQAPVLKDISFSIRPGEFVAISGASGSGKSTLLKLMLGLLRPTSGVILLDGYPANADSWKRFRQAAGVVVQDDRLLSGSVADNISCFDPEATFSRVVDAARSASIHDDIMRLPMQYETLVGDMGSSLSGGQRQRVLISRALYRNPSILVLDEGTANLDATNERVISETVANMTTTRVVVSHRSDLITHVDRMIIVSAGRIEDVETASYPQQRSINAVT